MVVDDDPLVLALFERFIRDIPGVEVRTAKSGIHALNLLERESCDVLITDQSMPGISGEDLLLTVARRWPKTRRILITGYWTPQLSGDADAHITLEKPITGARLRLHVETEIRRAEKGG